MKPTTDSPPETVNVELSRPTELNRDAGTLARTVALLSRITNAAVANEAGQFLRYVRERQRRIAAHYLDVRRPLRKAIADISEMEARDVAPWEAADAAVSAPLERWLKDQKALAEAENKRRLEEAERTAREEREAQADALRRAAAAAPSKSTAKRLETMARGIEASPALPVLRDGAVDAPKIDGISLPSKKVGTVTDFLALVQAVADGTVPLAALLPNQKVIDSHAADMGEHLNWPGVVVTEETSLRARGPR